MTRPDVAGDKPAPRQGLARESSPRPGGGKQGLCLAPRTHPEHELGAPGGRGVKQGLRGTQVHTGSKASNMLGGTTTHATSDLVHTYTHTTHNHTLTHCSHTKLFLTDVTQSHFVKDRLTLSGRASAREGTGLPRQSRSRVSASPAEPKTKDCTGLPTWVPGAQGWAVPFCLPPRPVARSWVGSGAAYPSPALY